MQFGSSLLPRAFRLSRGRGRVKFQWLFDTEQPTHIGHKLLQAFEKGDLLLTVHGGWRAAGCQLVEGISQPLVDDGVSLRGQQSLHELRVLCLRESRKCKLLIKKTPKKTAHSRKLKSSRRSLSTRWRGQAKRLNWAAGNLRGNKRFITQTDNINKKAIKILFIIKKNLNSKAITDKRNLLFNVRGPLGLTYLL